MTQFPRRGDLVLTPKGLSAFGRILPCSIGTGLLTRSKREGDGATPVGTHRVEAMYYRADRLACPAPGARPIGPRDLWSDDPKDAAYNTLVRHPYAHGHEKMRRGDPLYDIVIVLDWNRSPPEPGAGSAIFMHQWRRPRFPTEGCIALARRDLLFVSRHLHPQARLVIPPLAGQVHCA